MYIFVLFCLSFYIIIYDAAFPMITYVDCILFC
eukprot:UN16463